MGLIASKLPSLQRHLDYVRERLSAYKSDPTLRSQENHGKIFEAKVGASAATLEAADKSKDTEGCSKMED